MQYATQVSPPFSDIRDLVHSWAEEVTENAGELDDCYDSRLEEVENKSRDGFIPYTSGGFDGIAYASLRYAESYCCAPAAVQPFIEQDKKEAEEEWNNEHPEQPVSWLFESDEPDLFGTEGHQTERELWRERFNAFEMERLDEGGTYFYKVRALFLAPGDTSNESGEPEILFCVGINTDFEYGRDSIPWLSAYGSPTQQTEWLWEVTAKVADIDSEFIEAIRAEANDALRSA